MFHRASRIVVVAALVAAGLMVVAPAGAQEDPLPTDLPIIFVHGGGGSAAQYRTQQMRFASNGYPNVITAIDRADGVAATNPGFNDTFDGFIDDLLAQTGDDQVFVLAHSMGGPLMNSYLNTDDANGDPRAERVAKYVALDTGPADCTAITTECALILAGATLGGQGHTEAVTSPESFVLQHEFLTGETPATTEIVPEATPEISGRIVHSSGTGNWNWGPGDATMRVFEIDSDTGHRTSEDPIATFDFTDTDDGGTDQDAGHWGPVTVDPAKHYEFEVDRAASDVIAHYYMQNLTRSTDLIRFLTSAPDAGTNVNTESGPDHAAIVTLRYKEWRASEPDAADSLQISTTGTANDQPPVELLNDATAPGPCANFTQCQTIAVHAHDVGSDGVSNTAAPIPFFFGLTFQTGVDVYMPAADPPAGTIHMVSTHRGDDDATPQTLNLPNWASDEHRIVVEFNDYVEAEPSEPELPTDLPIVYVHGGAGSAAQYRTQQMRFQSNDYPNVVRAIDRAAGVDFNTTFDDYIDDILDQTGDDQVFVLGHSAGTAIMNGYLNSDPTRADRVSKYVSIDGAPANCGAIPTVCTNITAASMGQGHTQAVTSPESFVIQHEFLTGEPPSTTAIAAEEAPEISGRLINFPANSGPGEATMNVYEIDSLTGHRSSDVPVATFEFTDTNDGGTDQSAGAWGPLAVDPTKHYEFEVDRAVSDTTTHYYMQNFTHSTDLVRLLTSPPDAGTVVNTETGPDHAAAVVIRYMEWWGNQPEGENDSLKISTTSTDGPFYDSESADFPAFGDPSFPEQHPVELINAATSPSSNFSIGVHIHDVDSDGVTNTAAPIPFFFSQFFQTGVDLFMPASDPEDGTIHMVASHRGDVDRPQVINTPNWNSDDHRIVVEFNDYLEEEPELPVVFVHGGSGSAAQYQSQSMRFSSNDYSGHVAAIDRNGPVADQLDQLDDFVDDVLAQTGEDQVNLIGHSFGVLITNNYLSSDPARAAKVAKSIGVDSGSGPTPDVCPGNVPCKGIWGQASPGRVGIHGPYNNVQFANQGHVQTMTSAESFAAQYGFFTGNDPATTDILPEENPTIAGRAVEFPANLGPGDATLRIWEVDGATGHRTSSTPYATFEFTDADDSGGDQTTGAWGPVEVDPTQHYELEIQRAGSAITGHYYKEPFTHSNHFIRFLLLPEVALGPPLTEIGPNHAAVVALRYKEWWKAHPLTPDDSLQVGTSQPGGVQQPTVEVVTDAITPVSNGTIGIHMFDVGSDGVTDLGAPIPFWFSQGFQSGADVFMPASDPPEGTVTLRSVPHDAPDRVQMLNVPNWPSDQHRSGVEFNDFASPSETGVIEGRVVDDDDQPIEGAQVHAYLITDTWVGPGFATTGPDGTYAMDVPAGQFRLLFQGPTGGGFIGEWWDDSPTRAGGAHVLVTPGGTVPGVDAELVAGGTITGTVTDAGGPVEAAQVWVYASTDTWVGTEATSTGADGTYTLGGIPDGSYRVLFRPPTGSGLLHEWWDDVPQRSAGTILSVVAGGVIPGIDAQLGGP